MKKVLFCLILSGILGVNSQISAQNIQRLNLMFSYGLDLPVGDLADRFGYNFHPSLDLEYSFNDKWFVGIHGSMLLGSIVTEDPISNLRTVEGLLVSQQRDLAVITMKQRGFIAGIHAGRLFNLSKTENKHGIRVRAGLGILSHYIIFNNETASTNQLLGDYARGYNRFTRGLEVEQFIGYQFVNTKGNMNLIAGFNFVQGFTKNRRKVDFDTRMRNDTPRFDGLIGFRVGFAIKLYQVKSGDDIFY